MMHVLKRPFKVCLKMGYTYNIPIKFQFNGVCFIKIDEVIKFSIPINVSIKWGIPKQHNQPGVFFWVPCFQSKRPKDGEAVREKLLRFTRNSSLIYPFSPKTKQKWICDI